MKEKKWGFAALVLLLAVCLGYPFARQWLADQKHEAVAFPGDQVLVYDWQGDTPIAVIDEPEDVGVIRRIWQTWDQKAAAVPRDRVLDLAPEYYVELEGGTRIGFSWVENGPGDGASYYYGYVPADGRAYYLPEEFCELVMEYVTD